MSVLFDNNGNAFSGQLNIGQTVGWYSGNLLLSPSVFGKPDGGTYSDYFKKNSDGSIYFKVTQGNSLFSVFPAFKRANHSGSVTRDDGQVIEYDCIKVE